MKIIFLTLLSIALLVGSFAPCAAQEKAPTQTAASKPVAILTIASYDRLMADLAALGNIAGSPDLDKNIEGAIELLTQGQGLVGLDKSRPLGIVLSTDGEQIQPLLVLPVKDLKELLECLSGLIGEPTDSGGGVLEFSVLDQTFVLKELNGWAVIAGSREAVAKLPADPAALLGGLDKTYDVAGRLYMQNLPEQYRTLLIDQLRFGVEVGLARQAEESDDAFAVRKKTITDQIGLLTQAIGEVDKLTLGFNLDTKNNVGRLDLAIAPLPGTPTAALLGQLQRSTTNFAGFLLPDAAASLNLAAKLGPQSRVQIAKALSDFRTSALARIEAGDRFPDDVSKKLAKEMLDNVLHAISVTLDSGKVDAGATLTLGDKTMALVIGAYVVDPTAVEDALKKFAKLMEDNPDFPGIKFNAESYAGVRFHTTSIPVPQEDGVLKLLGDKLEVAVGIGSQSVYVAAGSGGLKLLKTAIDRSKAEAGKSVPLAQANFALGPMFRFAAGLQNQPSVSAMATELAKMKDKDGVRLTVLSDGNTTTLRIEAQEGVLRALGTALLQSDFLLPEFGE